MAHCTGGNFYYGPNAEYVGSCSWLSADSVGTAGFPDYWPVGTEPDNLGNCCEEGEGHFYVIGDCFTNAIINQPADMAVPEWLSEGQSGAPYWPADGWTYEEWWSTFWAPVGESGIPGIWYTTVLFVGECYRGSSHGKRKLKREQKPARPSQQYKRGGSVRRKYGLGGALGNKKAINK